MSSSEPRPSTSPVVQGFLDSDAAEWDAYIDARPDGTVFHTLRWRDAIRSIFRHRDCYLLARRNGHVCGVLPLVEIRSLVFGRTLISVPFGVYGGIVADDVETGTLLVDHARELARTKQAKYVELRHLRSHDYGLPGSDLYYTFIADVPDSADGCLARIPRKARAEVRKALKRDDLVAEVDAIDIRELYRLFSINKRQLGSPIFPSSLFWHVQNLFDRECRILSVRHQGTLVAAVMSFIYKGTIMPYYSGTVVGAERYSASNFMYYKLMEWAAEHELDRFDFGRSRADTGAFRFKKHQGFEPTPLSYDYILGTETAVPSLNPGNPKYQIAKSVFRRLPLPVARKIGSWLAKRAPF